MAYLVYTAPPIWLSHHRLDSRISAGAFSYFDREINFALWRIDDRISVGSYCAIARACIIFGGGNHFVGRASTFPFHAFGAGGADPFRPDVDIAPSRPTSIGHDVWLGYGVRVMPGTDVGHGCIVAAGSVVSGQIPPYSIVAGNPARVIRPRFRDTTIARLLALAWWDWPVGRVLANFELLMSCPDDWPADVELIETSNATTAEFPMIPSLRMRLARKLVGPRRSHGLRLLPTRRRASKNGMQDERLDRPPDT